jgi:hypothetical protein
LRKLGWHVETAYDADLNGKVADVNLLRHARRNYRIYLTFDDLRGESGENVGRELRTNGGNMIQIRGGADQDEHRITGKILFHYPDWRPFQARTEGVTVISDVKHNCMNYAPENWHHKFHKLDAEQFTAYLERQKRKPYKPRPHREKISPDQLSLS